MAQIICKNCSKEFIAGRSDAKWCNICKPKIYLAERHASEVRRQAKCKTCGTLIDRRSRVCRPCMGRARSENNTGELNPNWKGGKTHNRGYVMVRNKKPGKVHPYQGEHIIVWEEAHKQELPKGWNVHHKNGIKDDNRPENLVACSPSQHHSFGPEIRKEYEARIRELER